MTQQEGSGRPGTQVSAIISDSIHSSKWVDSCWFHSLTGFPGLVFLQLRETAWWEMEEGRRRKQKVPADSYF